MHVKDDEVRVVAQAITDAHAKQPGGDCEGRLDDARTIIAALDALTRHRKLADASVQIKDVVDASRKGPDASRTRPAISADTSKASADASTSPVDTSLDASVTVDTLPKGEQSASDTSQVIPIKGKRGRKPSGGA